ncbi:MAG: hypothetical protein ACLFWR_14220 [Acidimicrobiales bacterium]
MGDPRICESNEGERVVSANAAAYLEQSPAGRAEAISQLSALLAATHAELLDVVCAADVAGDWVDDGATGVVPWLVGQVAVANPTAREWVRVADALQDLPALRGTYAGGGLSWDQVRHATKFASSVDDDQLAASLPGLSANQIALMARQRRPIPDADANEAHAIRELSWRRDHRRGGFTYRGFLPFDQGAAINAAIDRHAERAGPDPVTGVWDRVGRRRADALHDLATRAIGADPDPDRATVVIHADAKVVDGEVAGNGFLGDVAICQTSVLRSLCHARVEVALHGPDGDTVGVARATQQIPTWLARQIGARDLTCRFPGCERRIRQIHHIVHWTKGGETNADNLCGLCWYHHRLVHEGDWKVEGDPDGELTFVSPDRRRRLTSRPQPLHDHVRRAATRTRRKRRTSPGTPREPAGPDPDALPDVSPDV